MSRTEAQKRADQKYRKSRKRITMDLQPEMYAALVYMSNQTGCSINEIIRAAIREWSKRFQKWMMEQKLMMEDKENV